MTNEVKGLLLLGGIIMAGVSYICTENKRNELKQAEVKRETKRLEASLPAEYWAAKEAETKANLEKKKIQLENEKQLELDKRNRAEREAQKIREFEKDAPESYWQHKKIEEEEKTKREQMRIDDQKAKRMAEAEKDVAKRNAEAIEASAKTIERAVRGNTSSNSWMYL